MSRFTFFITLLAGLPAFGQISPEKLAQGRMDKGKWLKVEQSVRKAMIKDSLDPEPKYLLTLYYFSASNPSFNIDSAHAYAEHTRNTFQLATLKEREHLKKIPLDSSQILRLSEKIDSASYERAKRLNTEPSYQYFMDHFPAAKQVSAARELRDEVAFLEALKINSWYSFQKFMMKYPASHRKGDAQSRYDKLLFEDKTKDQRLASYIKFYQQYPESPYHGLVEKNIFERSTASGSGASFQGFIEHYPESKWSERSKNIVYKLQVGEEGIFNPSWMTDSLRQVEQLNRFYWVPTYKSGLYGFMDEQGAEVIVPKFKSISEDYRCGDVHDRLIITSVGLLARNEAVLWPGMVQETKEMGLGFLLLTSDSGKFVIHESGFRIGIKSVTNAQVIANAFIGLEQKEKWMIYSLAGKALLPSVYDDIQSFDSLIVLTKGGKKILTTPGRIGRATDKVDFKEGFVVEDLRRWGSQHYWVRNGILEGVIDANLNFTIPLDRQVLRKTSFGFLQGKDDKLFIKGISRLENIPYQAFNEQAGWIRLTNANNRQFLYDRLFDRLTEADSVWFQGQLAFVQAGDSINAFLPAGQKLSFFGRDSFQFKEFRDSSAWIVMEDKKKKTVVHAASGVRLFTFDFDLIEAVSPDIFLVTKLNKKGLLSEDGKVLLPLEYDAIVASENSSFSLLKDKKFGWFDARTKVLIKPVFDRNIKTYNDRFRLAFKEKGYAFILPDGKPWGTFEWEEIQYWNDSSALVKRNFQWMVIGIRSQKVKLDRIRGFNIIKDVPGEKIYVVRQDNAYGVISSKAGTIIPIQYSDIINLGNKEVPLYFTERHIEEAGISVVVYYDQHGKIIRKQAMETEDFEKIYCDN